MVSAYSVDSIQSSGKPYMMYGTAWKKEKTADLVADAIRSGFRFIDTACQPKHYNEPGVGEGIVTAMKELGLQRSDLFIQTKFTSVDGQDPDRIPYDKNAPLQEQVMQSVQVSLRNLATTYIDSLVMHSPMRRMEDTILVWKQMEELVDAGVVRQIGISNCYDPKKFITIYNEARIKPSVLQNRFYPDSGFDVELRRFCRDHGVKYQSFWTLTGNIRALRNSRVVQMAKSKELTEMTLMYAFMMRMGHIPLCGTTSKAHMLEDVAIMERMQAGEKILSDQEMNEFSRLLGIDNYIEKEGFD
jgi:diketogulonate reductase-like aldo/keto reductase